MKQQESGSEGRKNGASPPLGDRAAQCTILDCTIRDGGLVNGHHFEHQLVSEVFRASSAAGARVVELGYRNSSEVFSREKFGPWMFCDAEDVARVTRGAPDPAKVSVMIDVGRVDLGDIGPAAESPIDLLRVATYVEGIDEAIRLGRHGHEEGYETTVNIMAISRDRGPALEEALCRIEEESPAHTAYIVDSFGALRPPEVIELVELFRRLVPSKGVGFHGHNNLQLAFANTLAAIEAGATWVDGTVYGMGRAAGNCPLELLLGNRPAPEFDLRPLLELIAARFVPLREELEWGYVIPYAITGLLGQHPRAAMALRNSERKDCYAEFFESLVEGAGGEEEG